MNYACILSSGKEGEEEVSKRKKKKVLARTSDAQLQQMFLGMIMSDYMTKMHL
jgi:hypothetical protein